MKNGYKLTLHMQDGYYRATVKRRLCRHYLSSWAWGGIGFVTLSHCCGAPALSCPHLMCVGRLQSTVWLLAPLLDEQTVYTIGVNKESHSPRQYCLVPSVGCYSGDMLQTLRPSKSGYSSHTASLNLVIWHWFTTLNKQCKDQAN